MRKSAVRRRYWAFISYSWSDRPRARSLHRRLERVTVPRRLRSKITRNGPSQAALRPIFRDDEEMPASGPLEQSLTDAIDESVAMVLLASTASANSRYVNLEVDHFLTTHSVDQLVVVAVDEETAGTPPLPKSLAGLIKDPLWVDHRGQRRLNGRGLARIAATLLGVDFSDLWRRQVRRRRRLAAAWCTVAIILAGLIGTVVLAQQDAQQAAEAAQRRRPEQQQSQFLDWLTNQTIKMEPDLKLSDVKLRIVRVDDLDDDGLLDYFVIDESPFACGSGGCTIHGYLTKAPGSYSMVFELLGSSTPRLREIANGTKEIVVTYFAVGREPIYSIYRLRGTKFELEQYEFCDGIIFEMCDPLIITPLPPGNSPEVLDGTVHRERPDAQARQVTIGAQGSGTTVNPRGFSFAIGSLLDGNWYLAELWKGYCGFVPSSAVSQ